MASSSDLSPEFSIRPAIDVDAVAAICKTEPDEDEEGEMQSMTAIKVKMEENLNHNNNNIIDFGQPPPENGDDDDDEMRLAEEIDHNRRTASEAIANWFRKKG